MTIRCKFSPLGKPEVDSYEPGTVLFENSPANDKTTNVNLPIKQGVFELMCCSGGGGHWCYIGCNSGSSGSFFKGVVYFDEDQTLEIQVGGGTTTYAHNGYPTYITNCIHCPEGKSANTTCSSKPAAPTLMSGMQVLSTEIHAGGTCGGDSLFAGTEYGADLKPGYMKLTYLRLEP